MVSKTNQLPSKEMQKGKICFSLCRLGYGTTQALRPSRRQVTIQQKVIALENTGL